MIEYTIFLGKNLTKFCQKKSLISTVIGWIVMGKTSSHAPIGDQTQMHVRRSCALLLDQLLDI